MEFIPQILYRGFAPGPSPGCDPDPLTNHPSQIVDPSMPLELRSAALRVNYPTHGSCVWSSTVLAVIRAIPEGGWL